MCSSDLYVKDVIEDLEENLDIVVAELETSDLEKLIDAIEQQAKKLIAN